MKKIILIILMLNWCAVNLYAEDISDFQIEGISLYDSATDHFSKKILKDGKADYYTSDKFITSAIFDEFETYDYLQLSYKKNDNKYKIVDISGTKRINYSECLKSLDEIANDISSIYNSNEVEFLDKQTYDHPADKSKQAKITDIVWSFPNGDLIIVQCYDWESTAMGKELNYVDELKIAISNAEFDLWVSAEAYK